MFATTGSSFHLQHQLNHWFLNSHETDSQLSKRDQHEPSPRHGEGADEDGHPEARANIQTTGNNEKKMSTELVLLSIMHRRMLFSLRFIQHYKGYKSFPPHHSLYLFWFRFMSCTGCTSFRSSWCSRCRLPYRRVVLRRSPTSNRNRNWTFGTARRLQILSNSSASRATRPMPLHLHLHLLRNATSSWL